MKSLTAITLLAVAATGAAAAQGAYIELINDVRAEAGAGALQFDPALQHSAQLKADMLHETGTFEHGNWPQEIYDSGARGYWKLGENLARDFKTPEQVVRAWAASPAHAERLTDPAFNRVGIAESDDGKIVVAHFGCKP